VRLANNANPSVILADAVRFDYVVAQDFPTNNSIPIWWRDFFFGGPADLISDPDADGYHTAREYVMGTNPTNAAIAAAIRRRVQATTTGLISFWPRHDGRACINCSRGRTWGSRRGLKFRPAPISAPDGVGRSLPFPTTNAPQNFYRLRVNLLPAGELNLLAVPRSSLVTVPFEDQFCGPFRVFVREAAPE
jgi:hypothetical protein